MSKELKIKLTKCLLVLSEKELIDCLLLKPEVLERSIKRGKYMIRNNAALERQLKFNARNFDRWQLYKLLKNNVKIDDITVSFIEGMEKQELKEGLIEYLLARNRLISSK